MTEDELRPLRPAERPLDTLSIADLEARIASLKREIAELEALVARKQAQRSAAEALFTQPQG